MPKFVRDLMKIGVPTCQTTDHLDVVAKIMMRDGADAVIVMDEFGACGVVSQTDLVKAFPRNWELLTAKEVMSERIVSITPDAAAAGVADMMLDEKVHQVFVMHDHPGPARPSAVVTMRAIVREMAGLPQDKPVLPVKKAATRKK